jgi:anti-sigma factor RsiW
MTLELESQNHTKPHLLGNLPAPKAGHVNQSTGDIDMLKRDRFELLSAYLDGEVTAAERRQVEDWLANDPEIQRLYGRLLKLRQGLHTLPVPPAEQPAEQTIQQVFGRLDRRRNRAVGWGGAAIAALFIGALSGVLPSRQSIQIAKSPEPAGVAAEPLRVALNTPVVEIPKAAIAAPKNAVR